MPAQARSLLTRRGSQTMRAGNTPPCRMGRGLGNVPRNLRPPRPASPCIRKCSPVPGKRCGSRSISGIPGTGSGSPLPAGTGRTWKTPSGSLKTPAALPWCTRTISSTLFSPLSTPAWASRTSTLERQTILAVDLGVNHGAVCSAMDAFGNILGRAFDPFYRERNALDGCIRAIRHVQKKSGAGQEISAVYQRLDGLKWNYVRQLAHWVVQQARQRGAYGIVLEYLGKMKGRGGKKDRIHHWCKAAIRDLVKGMAFRYGIRVFLVNPKNTSRLAYDGSGEVCRDKDNFSLCTFASGKRYASDLSASYNIGARYFLRAMQKANGI